MKTAVMIASFVCLAVAFAPLLAPCPVAAQASPADDIAESLSDAVIRINSDVTRDYGVLSPRPLTMSSLKAAIESAANEVAESNFPERTSYVNTLTQMVATGQIPDSTRFFCMPINGSYSKKQKAEARDGRHVTISLNYVLEMPSKNGKRVIGLTDIVEVFQIIKPQEQDIPFQPPEDKGQPKRVTG
jgi:hypothetical protein